MQVVVGCIVVALVLGRNLLSAVVIALGGGRINVAKYCVTFLFEGNSTWFIFGFYDQFGCLATNLRYFWTTWKICAATKKGIM